MEDRWWVYCLCACALIVSGVGMIILNLFGNLNSTSRDRALNQMLWGFEMEESIQERELFFRFAPQTSNLGDSSLLDHFLEGKFEKFHEMSEFLIIILILAIRLLIKMCLILTIRIK